ncbi:C-3 sterol dehydrogenase/C-4 decarboxylase family protein [Aaosphaeria arxii CBS 175.79]|uniref:C-3 sterol dehydrogenase/C-4 decarboxylase family protein n=1 Tax=Aaosphaeria arxii CBS 175.79 TaxID=1450172 RepID=A0A6A5XSD3_9PLEO|nr:C-3 sterol dehydrogenase/C-4 decarboxylase family protein [Aaosphaeria arxii CBS 175.79]KAF2015610.1 C-3 sterol dehydrogenase/C-4 decarboxylase family protein [Aaosphaeria arxii CBS 175.79]
MATLEQHSVLNQRRILITGGSGGLASQILQLFSQRGCEYLHSVDLRQPSHRLDGITYHQADLTDPNSMHQVFQEVRPNMIIHTASPKFDAPKHIMYKVNVEGTKTLIQTAKKHGALFFVYTSSASVISDAKADLKNADETFPVILGDQQPEFYVSTKALAETYVLSQNTRSQDGSSHFLACAIRPSGIFGVGDLVTKVQIGDNGNLFDFTENKNVAHAHYLAAAALARCEENPPLDDVRVDGEAFLVTNDEPRYFWDFTRTVWRYAGDKTRPNEVWVITRSWALLLAGLLEWVFWIFRLGEPPLTKTKVRLSCMTRYFCIDKAKNRLGYKPLVGLEEGLRQGVEDCMRRRNAEQSAHFIGALGSLDPTDDRRRSVFHLAMDGQSKSRDSL